MQNALDRAIDCHSEAAFAFLEALVRAPSVVGHEHTAMEVFAQEAGALGLTVTRLPFAPGPVAHARAGVAPPQAAVAGNRFQVLAETPGDGPLRVLLNGHLDVVPAASPHLWTTPPFVPTRRDGQMFGRGAADMKCGFAVGTLALRALRDVAPDLFATRRLGFVAVVEEECTGNGTLRSIADHGIVAEEVIVLEPTDLGLLVGCVGVLWVDVEIAARSGHAHSAGQQSNAIDLGMGLVAALRDWATETALSHPEPGLATNAGLYAVNLGKLRSGDWTSSTPCTAVLSLRVGYPRGWSAVQAEAAVRAVVARAAARDAGFAAPPVVTLTGLRAEGYLLEDPSPLLQGLRAAHRAAHGVEPETYSLGSTTDARFYLNDAGVPAVCFGPTGTDLHGIDEGVDLQSIVDAARTLARFLLMRFGAAEVAP